MTLEQQLANSMWWQLRKAMQRVEIARLWYLGNGRLQDIPISVPSSGTLREDIERLFSRTASVGQSILNTRRTGAVSQVSLTGSAQFGRLHLPELARKLYDDLFIQGIAAVTTYRDMGGKVRFARLGGYLEPVRDPSDSDHVTGIMQIMQTPGLRLEYVVRVFAFEAGDSRAILRTWPPTSTLETKFSRPAREEEVAAPSWAQVGQTADDSSAGEGSSLLGLVLGYAATTMRIERVADAHAYPILWVQGIINQLDEVGPNKTFVFDNGGSLHRLESGDIGQLRDLRNDLDAMLSSQFSLPGRVSGAEWPSGEALAEARLNYTAQSRSYAAILTGLLGEGLNTYAQLAGLSAPTVAVEPYEAYEVRDKLTLALQLYREGVIPLRQVAILAQQLLPLWTDQDLESFLARRETSLTPEEAINALGL